jgi:probable phosphoglycerate mutase
MPVLLLTRHATNDFVKAGRLPGQLPNIHLNEEGRNQAAALGIALKAAPLAAVYASHLERAMETAYAVARHHGLAVNIDPRFADTNAGDVGGMVVNDIGRDERFKAAWDVVVKKPTEGRLPGGESLVEMHDRVMLALADVVARHADPPPAKDADGKDTYAPPHQIMIVMHADTVKAALAHYLGMPFNNFQRVGVNPASFSAVVVDNANKPLNVQFVNRIPY